ncbi:MAG TPA: AAA family ATPase [Solirubrobacterales bacterium]|jgi:predicted ATPase/class 3 adenylate cyclase|nr:AAA family ATPase [Solirubrobacterales bacterium]
MDPVETVTVLFTDLVGSTEMTLRIGPAAAEEVRLEHFGLLREAIGETGGEEVKNLGDGLMVTFGSASAALACAAAMQRKIARRNRRAEEPLSVRIGISLGEATRREDDYFGHPVIEAARLCAAADGDEVLLSDLVRVMAISGDHTLEEVGELDLKGMAEPVKAFRLARTSGDDASGIPLPPRLSRAPSIGFVGRLDERAELADIAAAAEGGHRQVALISGEPGIGKSRLAAQAALDMHSRGAAALFGRSTEDVDPPHRPWTEALSHYVEHAPRPVIERHVERHGGELLRVVPGLADRIPDVPAPKSTDAETVRYMLRAAAIGMFVEATREQPVVVILDDVQWADSQSLALLKHLVSSTADCELLVLGTHRDSELTRGHPLNQVLGDLRREEGVRRIGLTGLEADDVGALMESVLGASSADGRSELADEISSETDGNPFFVGEILRHLDEGGSLGSEDLPQSIREVVTSRAERLGTETASLLSTAAVIGRDFDLELLAHAAGEGQDEVLDRLDGAVKGALLLEGRSPGRFIFAHSLVNNTLYEELGATRRAQIHRRIAESLEELCGAELGARSEELAWHWLRTTTPQMPLKAAEHSIRAGERALEALAPAEALDWFQRAIEVLDQTPEADPGLRCDAVIGLGDAQRQLGDPEYSETLLEACELASEHSDGPRMARAAQANTRGFTSVVGQVDERRVEALEGALELCEEDRSRAALLSLLAVELSYDADLDRRMSLSADAVRLARESGDRHALAWALARRQIAIAAAETLEERLAEADEMVALADDLDDTMLRYWAHVWRAMDALELGDLETQGRHRVVQEEIAEATGQPMFHWVNTFAPALLATLAGDFERAEEITNRSAELGSESGQPDVLAIYAAQIHVIRYEQGRLDEVLEIQEQAVAEAPLLDAYLSALALSYIELEDSDQARVVLERLAAKKFAMTATLSSRPALCFIAEVAARLGDRDSCALLHEKLLPFRDQLCYSGVTLFGTIERYLGLTATCAGRYEEAEEHFRRSAATCERIEAPSWLARTRHEWALMLLRRNSPGDRESAESLLAKALDAAGEFGCRTLERRVSAAIEDPDRAIA